MIKKKQWSNGEDNWVPVLSKMKYTWMNKLKKYLIWGLFDIYWKQFGEFEDFLHLSCIG